MVLNKSLRLALIALLEENVIVSSWGISNIVVNPSILQFDVKGFNYEGTITIEVSESGYIVIIGNNTFCHCSLSNLVDLIDKQIEYTGNYTDKLRNWLMER